MRTYKLTLTCDSVPPTSGQRGVVGIPLSEAWFKVFQYWLSNRLEAEGLKVRVFAVEEEVNSDPVSGLGYTPE